MSARAGFFPLLWLLALAGLAALFATAYSHLSAPPPSFTAMPAARPGFTLPFAAPPVPFELAPYSDGMDEYVVLAFAPQGLFSTPRPGGLVLRDDPAHVAAQVIRRGSTPEIPETGMKTETSTPAQVRPDVGPTGPAGPGSAPPPFEFPLAHVRVSAAGDTSQSDPLAETAVVAACSPAWGCAMCHGRDPGNDDRLGLAPATEVNILKVHDRLNGTALAEDAAPPEGDKHGITCAGCHGASPTLPNLSTAVHGAHALMGLPDSEQACNSCHPADSAGVSLLQRDLHAGMGIACTSCHGTLREHALALLKAQTALPAAKKRFGQVAALKGEGRPAAEILPRLPGENLPDCAGCHSFTEHPVPGEVSAFNKWTKNAAERFSRRFEDTGKLRCPTCHGAPHAMYPAQDITGDDRDNLQARRYLKGDGPVGANRTCGVCHMTDMDFFVHHGLPE